MKKERRILKKFEKIQDLIKEDNVEKLQKATSAYQELENWINNGEKGSKYCYYRGAYIGNSVIQRIFYKAYEDRKVTLAQRRDAAGDFSYWAFHL